MKKISAFILLACLSGCSVRQLIVRQTAGLFDQGIAAIFEESDVAAVKESFRWLNVAKRQSAADAAFDTWYAQEDELNNVNVSYTDATDKLKVVLFQKYMALNGTLPLETWTDYRRNGAYPAVPLSINTSRTSPIIPVRFLYPQREYDLNEANVVANGTISQFTSKIWWMN